MIFLVPPASWPSIQRWTSQRPSSRNLDIRSSLRFPLHCVQLWAVVFFELKTFVATWNWWLSQEEQCSSGVSLHMALIIVIIMHSLCCNFSVAVWFMLGFSCLAGSDPRRRLKRFRICQSRKNVLFDKLVLKNLKCQTVQCLRVKVKILFKMDFFLHHCQLKCKGVHFESRFRDSWFENWQFCGHSGWASQLSYRLTSTKILRCYLDM